MCINYSCIFWIFGLYNAIINIIPHLVGLQTKGKFSCFVCGPRVISRRSKSLRTKVFDEYRYLLHKNHRYWTIRNIFLMGRKRLEKTLEEWHLNYGNRGTLRISVKITNWIRYHVYQCYITWNIYIQSLISTVSNL